MKSISLILFLFFASWSFGQSTIDRGLVAFFPFCGNSVDHSGNNNNGVVNGGVTFGKDRIGNLNSAAHFSGVNGFIRVPASISLDTLTENITVACWFYTESYHSVWASLLSKSNNTSTPRQYSIVYDKDGRISFSHTLVATKILELNRWYHIAITRDDSIAKCYLDGVLIDSSTMVNDIKPTNFPLNIGSDPHIVTEFHRGWIDDVRIYNRILSKDEVRILSSNNFDCSTVAINEPGTYPEIKLYPNPTEDVLTIESEDLPRVWFLKVYDSLGKLVQTGKLENNNRTIDFRGLNPGIYFLVIETEEGAYLKKVVKTGSM